MNIHHLKIKAVELFPGLAVTVMVALSAQFLSEHYGAPAMLMAILLGIALQFLSEDQKTARGISFASKYLLRIGVALLGVRISAEMAFALGLPPIILIVLGVAATILFALLLGRLLGQSTRFSFLTGGAVAICGASAAMAIASILPQNKESERDLAFTVVTVTVLSTLAMIIYPVLINYFGLSSPQIGMFLGGTIHDVAQVVGAGFSISDETGDLATLVKLIRVVMLAPVVLIAAVIIRQRQVTRAEKFPPLIPGFVLAFLAIAAINSFGVIPPQISDFASGTSRAFLLTAIAAVGMQTSIKELSHVGGKALGMLLVQTLFLATFVLLGIHFFG